MPHTCSSKALRLKHVQKKQQFTPPLPCQHQPIDIDIDIDIDTDTDTDTDIDDIDI